MDVDGNPSSFDEGEDVGETIVPGVELLDHRVELQPRHPETIECFLDDTDRIRVLDVDTTERGDLRHPVGES